MRFEYLEAKSIDEAISLLERYNGRSSLIAGGTDLLVQIRNKARKPEYVIDIAGIPGLDSIKYNAGGLSVGALASIKSVEKSAEIQRNHPMLSQAAGLLGSSAIRNMATIGGNVCNASPSAETPPSLIALGASARTIGPGGEKVIPLEEFFLGPGKSALGPKDILVELQVPPMAAGARGAYFKHAVRGSIDLAIVGVAAVVEMNGGVCQDARIVVGAVAPTPVRVRQAEDVLKGKKIDEALIEKAGEAAAASEQCCPISDVRASAEYRKEMVKVFTRRAIRQALGA